MRREESRADRVWNSAEELEAILDAARPDLSRADEGHIRELIATVKERSQMDPDWCVVGVLGATGSGKSSLVNALVDSEAVEAGVLRPTTSRACAVLPGCEAPAEVLGWLGVKVRVQAPPLVGGRTAIIDLPDIDSVERAHWEVAGRLSQRVDALLVVVDPQKYADMVLHDEWLPTVGPAHASLIVVLTHSDALTVEERADISADLRRLLDSRGMGTVPLVSVSSVTGEGIAALRSLVRAESARVSSTAMRAASALRQACARLRDAVGVEGIVSPLETDGVSQDLAKVALSASGADRIVEAARESAYSQTIRSGGWWGLRWWRGRKMDPLKSLGVGEKASGNEEILGGCLPRASSADEAVFVNAVRAQVGRRSNSRPRVWRSALIATAEAGARTIPERVQRAISSHPLGAFTPSWVTRTLNVVQGIGWIAALVGAAWIAVVQLGRFTLFDVRVPFIGFIPAPTLLLAAGMLLTFVVAGANRWVASFVASRRARRVRAGLLGLCRDEIDSGVMGAVRTEDMRQSRIASFLSRVNA